jgi:hypothetical protein
VSDLCEWDPEHNRPAKRADLWGKDSDGAIRRRDVGTGCPNPAQVVLGANGAWRLCATCAELPRFRRYRVARRITDGRALRRDCRVLRRDRAGWWWRDADNAFEFLPAPLAEVLAVAAATRDWPETNRRRGELIAREAYGLTREEAVELERLQAVADLRTDLLDPFEPEVTR